MKTFTGKNFLVRKQFEIEIISEVSSLASKSMRSLHFEKVYRSVNSKVIDNFFSDWLHSVVFLNKDYVYFQCLSLNMLLLGDYLRM